MKEAELKGAEEIEIQKQIVSQIEPLIQRTEQNIQTKLKEIKKKTKIPAISLSGLKRSTMGEHLSRKTLFDFQTLGCTDSRFETINLLPNLASKFKRNNQGFSMRTQSKRDPNLLIAPIYGDFKSSEEMGNKPPIRCKISFEKQVSRNSIAENKPLAPNIYKYADMVSKAIDKFKLPKVPLAGYTMDKTPGRDNAMYNISEISNLKTKEENAFYELM